MFLLFQLCSTEKKVMDTAKKFKSFFLQNVEILKPQQMLGRRNTKQTTGSSEDFNIF